MRHGAITMTAATESYYRDGYVALTGLFAPEILQAFFNRMQADLAAAGRPLTDYGATGPLLRRQAIEVYAYEYTPMLTFLWGLTPRMSAAAGKDLLPTYAYFRLYQQDDVCRIHADRPACEHSLSLTMGYSDNQPWALSVATDRMEHPRVDVTEDFGDEAYGSVAMAPGDGVLYQGVHHRHGRVDPNPNQWSAHLFMHWIDRAGPYAAHAFDRPTLEAAAKAKAGAR